MGEGMEMSELFTETRWQYVARHTFSCALVAVTVVPLFAWLGWCQAGHSGGFLLGLYVMDLANLFPWFWRRRR